MSFQDTVVVYESAIFIM